MGINHVSALWPIEGSVWGYSHLHYMSYDTLPSKTSVENYNNKNKIARYNELYKKISEAQESEVKEFHALKKELQAALNFSTFSGVVGKSTLKSDSGTAYIYAQKHCGETHVISLMCIAVMPLYVAGAIAYNVLRILPIVVYISICLIYEKSSGKQIFAEDRKFKVRDITDQIGKSLWNVIRTPYYALGFFFGLIYSLLSPLNGRKVAAGFEREWNHGIDRYRSIWSVQGRQKDFLFEGGGAPSHLGEHAFYLSGCYQPNAIVTYENGKVIKITSISGRTEFEGYIEYKGSCFWPSP